MNFIFVFLHELTLVHYHVSKDEKVWFWLFWQHTQVIVFLCYWAGCIPIELAAFTAVMHVAVIPTWQSAWWRTPLLWTDRWHILSGLSHYPVAIYLLWPNGSWLQLLISALCISVCFIMWQVVKKKSGKNWASLPTRIYNYFKGLI